MKEQYRIHALSAGILLGLILLQITFGRLIGIMDIQPDFVLVGLIIVALRTGQLPATIAGFATGLILDLSIGEVVGLGAFAKTWAGFIAGYFFSVDKKEITLRSPKFIVITMLVALAHNGLYLIAYFHRPDLNLLSTYVHYGLGGSLYTTAFGAICMLIMMRTGSRLRV